jgi:DNA-binding beta-propeller fold protein YncE
VRISFIGLKFSLYGFAWLICLALPQLAFASFDDGARYAFTASGKSKTISIIDLHKQKLASTVELDTRPDSIAASENLKALLVAHRKAKRLTLVDLTSKQLQQFEYPLSITPDYLAVSPLGETAAVYDREQGVLEMHAIRRKEVLLRAEGIYAGDEFTFSLDGSSIYWVDKRTGSLNAIDLWSNKKSLRLAGDSAELSSLSRSTDGLLGFVSDALENRVYVINLKTFELVKTLPTGGRPGRAWGTADGQFMLIPNKTDGTVTALSVMMLEPLYTVTAVKEPISINPGWLDTTAAIIGASGEVVFLDVATGMTDKPFKLQGVPEEGIVTSDSKTLAVPTPASGAVAFFDMRKRDLIVKLSGLPDDIGKASLAISNNLCH